MPQQQQMMIGAQPSPMNQPMMAPQSPMAMPAQAQQNQPIMMMPQGPVEQLD